MLLFQCDMLLCIIGIAAGERMSQSTAENIWFQVFCVLLGAEGHHSSSQPGDGTFFLTLRFFLFIFFKAALLLRD